MIHQFTVGEYKTPSDNTAIVLEVGPDNILYGREQYRPDGPWYAKRWTREGSALLYQVGSDPNHDLVPPTRTIWMVSWINRFGATKTQWTNSKEGASLFVQRNGRILIAITGPHEVPQ